MEEVNHVDISFSQLMFPNYWSQIIKTHWIQIIAVVESDPSEYWRYVSMVDSSLTYIDSVADNPCI